MFSRFIDARSKASSEALLREALYNPEVARDMASMIGLKQNKPDAVKRLNVWLFNIGLGAEDERPER